MRRFLSRLVGACVSRMACARPLTGRRINNNTKAGTCAVSNAFPVTMSHRNEPNYYALLANLDETVAPVVYSRERTEKYKIYSYVVLPQSWDHKKLNAR